MELDITFDNPSWEEKIDAVAPEGSISACQMLTLLEDQPQEEFDNILEILVSKKIRLDIGYLPPVAANDQAAARLRLEQELVRQDTLASGLPENDPLRIFLAELSSIPAPGDLTTLAEGLRNGQEEACRQLMNGMLPQVVMVAKSYVGKGVLLLDLIQEASLGIWQGLSRYSGGDIEEYCAWWIHQYLAAAVLRQAMDDGMGQKLKAAVEDYRSVDERLLAELGRNPTMEEITQALHIPAEETERIALILANARNMNRAKQPEPDQLPQEEDQAVEDTAYFQMRQRVAELLSALDEQDAQLLTLRYGLEGGLPMDPQQVGVKLGLTVQEVINREAAALAKLRQ